jgi:hypothetical protein
MMNESELGQVETYSWTLMRVLNIAVIFVIVPIVALTLSAAVNSRIASSACAVRFISTNTRANDKASE